MSLKGSLNSVDLANIFQMLSINQKEGTLHIFDGETRKSIYFSPEGVTMLARGDAGKDSLGRILLRFDQVTEEQLAAAMDTARESGRPLAAVLRERGTPAPDVIDEALRLQIEEEIFNLFIWKDLTFEFHDGISDEDAQALNGSVSKIVVNVNSLLMEAARRLDEWELIRRQVPSMGEIYRYTGRNMELRDEIFQEPWIDKVLGAVDGRRTVDEVVARSFGNRFEVCRVLSLLVEQGAIEPTPPEDLNSEAHAALAEGRTAEAIRFLERLIEVGGAPPDACRVLGEACESASEFAKAARYYLRYAETALEAGAVKEAFDFCRKANALIPTDLAAGQRLVEIFNANSDLLREDREDVVRRGKEVAECLYELREQDKAIEILKMLLEIEPDDLALRNLLVNFYLSGGRASAAIDEFLRMADWYTRRRDWDQVSRLLRRVLSIDRSREDVAARLDQLMSKKQRKRRSLRHLALIGLLGVCVCFLLWVYVDYELGARSSIASEESRENQILADLHRDVTAATSRLDAFGAALAEPAPDVPALAKALHDAESLRGRYAAQIDVELRRLDEIAQQFRYSSARNQALQRQEALRQKRSRFDTAVEAARALVQRRAMEYAAAADRDLVAGRASAALDSYRKAWDLAADRQALAENGVDQTISHLSRQLETIHGRVARVRTLGASGDHDTARTEAMALIEDCFILEVLEAVDLPVRVESAPSGAAVFVNGEDSGIRTPGVIAWHPASHMDVEFRANGFHSGTVEVPAADPRRQARELARLKDLSTVSITLRKEIAWSAEVDGAVEGAPVAAGGQVVVATRNSGVFLLDPATRQVRELYRSRAIGGYGAGPVIAGDRVYVASVDGEVAALPLAGGPPAFLAHMEKGVYGAPVIEGSALVVADEGGNVVAFDAASGHELWRRRVAGQVRAALVSADGIVYVPTTGGRVVALTAAKGEPRAEYSPAAAGTRPVLAPRLSGNTLFAVDADGVAAAFDVRGGALLWRLHTGAGVRAEPAILGDTLFVAGMDGRLRAIRAGKVLGETTLSAPPLSGPAVRDGFLFVASEQGMALAAAFDGDALRPLWEVALPSGPGGALRVIAPIAIAGSTVVAATEGGAVHLLER